MIDNLIVEQPANEPQVAEVETREGFINLSENDVKNTEKHEKSIKNQEISTENEDFNQIIGDSDNLEAGSLFGKFKDAKSLLDAYNNLQKEFTRRSQRLNELEKEVSKNQANEATTFESDGENWHEVVARFIEANPKAKTYATEISEEIINDRSMSIERAYERVLARHFVEPKEMVNNEEFLNRYIYSSELIRDRILQEFFEGLKNNPVPKLMGLDKGEINMTSKKAPATIADAGKLALDLLKK